MKGLKYITGCSLTLLLLAACNKEEGPSIDDYFLNYEIPEIPVTEDYQVGIFYNKNGDLAQTPNGEPNFTRWELLTKLDSELSAKTNYNHLPPQIMPESQQEGLLEVKGDDQSFRMIPMVQQHVNGCIEAGVGSRHQPRSRHTSQQKRLLARHYVFGTFGQRWEQTANAAHGTTRQGLY